MYIKNIIYLDFKNVGIYLSWNSFFFLVENDRKKIKLWSYLVMTCLKCRDFYELNNTVSLLDIFFFENVVFFLTKNV